MRYAVRGVHRRFSWDALNVTKYTECGGTKCYFPASLQGEHGDEGWLVLRIATVLRFGKKKR